MSKQTTGHYDRNRFSQRYGCLLVNRAGRLLVYFVGRLLVYCARSLIGHDYSHSSLVYSGLDFADCLVTRIRIVFDPKRVVQSLSVAKQTVSVNVHSKTPNQHIKSTHQLIDLNVLTNTS